MLAVGFDFLVMDQLKIGVPNDCEMITLAFALKKNVYIDFKGSFIHCLFYELTSSSVLFCFYI